MIKQRHRDTFFYAILAAIVFVIIGINYWHVWRFPLLHSRSFARQNQFDVVVVGAEPEGVAAAIAASRSGAKVLLTDHHDDVGGLFTYGMLNTLDMNYGLRNRLLTKGIFYEFYRQIEGTSFDVKNAQAVLHSMVAKESNITFWRNTKFLKAITNKEHKILGVELLKGNIQRQIFAPRIIDATQDADVAASAGVPFMYGGADRGYPNKSMAATLVFGVQNIEWEKIQNLFLHDGDPMTGADRFSAWGFADEMSYYKPVSNRIRMRGLNMGRQRDGTVLINALLIFDVNGTSPQSKANAMNVAKRELPHVMQYLRQNITGFKTAKLVLTAPELYIRESRHVIGEYRLTINDVLENRDHWDRIALASYSVDIQAMDHKNFGLIIGEPVQYSVPFRSIVPVKVDDLLVVGRSASYTSVAAGSARVVPVGMCEGEAAGVAAAYSIWKNISFRKMIKDEEAIYVVQEILKQRGAYLQPFEVFNQYTLNWSYPALRIILPTSAVQGRYTNNFRFEEPITEKQFLVLASGILRVLKGENHVLNIEEKFLKHSKHVAITPNKLSYYLLIFNGNKENYDASKNYLKLAQQENLISSKALAHGFGNSEVKFSHAYELLAHLYGKLLKGSSNVFAPNPENTN